MIKWLDAHVTIPLPEDVYERLKKHKEIRWGAVARDLLIQYLDELEKFKGTQTIQMFRKEIDEKKSETDR